MKQLIMIGVAALLLGCTSVKKDEFVIKGHIGSYPKDILICAYEHNGNFVLDTIRVKNGKLSYRKQLQEPIVANLVSRDPNTSYIAQKNGIIPGESVMMFMEPGTVLEIDMDNHRWPELTWKGGTRNNDLMKLYARTLPLKREAFEVLKQIYKEGISEEEEKALSEKRMNLLNQAKEETHMFVRSNPASYAAMYLLGGLYNNMELDEYVAVFESFDPELLATSLGREMREKIDIALRTEVGGTAPEFEKKDMNGQMVKLSDYRGKYVLLDFWGSWCSPCRASHPHLREIEAKYAPEGLVVINIASENGKDAHETWIKAVKEDKMTWTQILNNEGWEQCDVVKQFAITAFPTKVLIGPDGKILVRTVGESEPIDQKLQEVYGK